VWLVKKHTAWRIARMILLGLAGTIGGVVLLLLPDLYRLVVGLIPLRLRVWWVEGWALVLVLIYVITQRLSGSHRTGAISDQRSKR